MVFSEAVKGGVVFTGVELGTIGPIGGGILSLTAPGGVGGGRGDRSLSALLSLVFNKKVTHLMIKL